MKITPKSDYSFLFNSNNNSNNSNFLGIDIMEYSSIKRGSYGKLLKAYYGQEGNDKNTSSVSKPVDKADNSKNDTKVKEYNGVSASAGTVSESAEKLISKSTDSLFNKGDIDEIYSAVKDFAAKVNDFMKNAKDSSSKAIADEAGNLGSLINSYSKSLESVGIKVGEDSTLSIDEDAFKNSNITSIKGLFNGNQSFAYSVATKTSLIGTTAKNEANTVKNYTNTGNYLDSDSYSVGNLLNSMI